MHKGAIIMDYIRNEALIEIGERIQEERKKRNLTQTQFAKMLSDTFSIKADRSKIAKWETGRLHIQDDELIALADCFNVDCDYLIRGVKSENVSIAKKTGLSEDAINVLHSWKERDASRIKHLNDLFSLEEHRFLLMMLFKYCDECERHADVIYNKIKASSYSELHFAYDDKSSPSDNFELYCDSLHLDEKSVEYKELRYLIFECSQKFINLMEGFQEDKLKGSKKLYTKKMKDGANNG